MSSRVLKYREFTYTDRHALFMPHPGLKPPRTSGYSFPCDARGSVKPDSLNEYARANFYRCITNPSYWRNREVQTWQERNTVPGLMECDCGAKLEMWGGGHDIPCDACGREYTSSGQLLAPRSQWGEETGETAMDYYMGVANPEAAFEEY